MRDLRRRCRIAGVDHRRADDQHVGVTDVDDRGAIDNGAVDNGTLEYRASDDGTDHDGRADIHATAGVVGVGAPGSVLPRVG